MPHKCVRCGTTFPDFSGELMKGCTCGSRVFVYFREAQMLGNQDFGWLEKELSEFSKEQPVTVDAESVENIRVLEKGSYELDLRSLMKGNPMVVRSEKGIYYIKIPPFHKK